MIFVKLGRNIKRNLANETMFSVINGAVRTGKPEQITKIKEALNRQVSKGMMTQEEVDSANKVVDNMTKFASTYNTMDIKDTEDLLNMIAKRFYEKYGEHRIDGIVLDEFEADATEIIYKKLWYLDTQKRKFRVRDYLATAFVALCLSWYSLLIFGSPPFMGMTDFDIRTFIWDELLGSLSSPVAMFLNILYLIAVVAIPAIAVYLLFKFTYVKDTFRFA